MREEFIDIEIVTNKTTVKFIKNILTCCGLEFRYEEYRKLIYGFRPIETKEDLLVKSTYDSYIFLMLNRRNMIMEYLLKRYYLLLTSKILAPEKITEISSFYYMPSEQSDLERIVDFHYAMYGYFEDETEAIKKVIALSFFNFMLIRYGYGAVRFLYIQLLEYDKIREQYNSGDKEAAYAYFTKMVLEETHQSTSYYDNLKETSREAIISQIREDKTLIENLYKVKSMALFGSYAKGKNREDSDIDLLVKFNEDMSHEEKINNRDMLSKHISTKFNRYADILECSYYLSPMIIHELISTVKIF
jgi:uncharacterized protein